MHKRTVLIVDDSTPDLALVINIVKQKYKVLAANNGEDALKIAEKSKPDLVLLDVTMPGLNGYETCRQIKQRLPDTSVVFISANTSKEEVLKGYEVGGSDYITKPFEPDVLLNKVTSALKQSRQNEMLKREVEHASGIAMEALSNSNELSELTKCIGAIFQAGSLSEISVKVMEYISDNGVEGILQLRASRELIELGSHGHLSSEESEWISKIAEQNEDFINHTDTMSFSSNNASLILLDTGALTDVKKDRLIQHYRLIVETMNERINLLDKMSAAVPQENAQSLKKVKDLLNFVVLAHKEVEDENISILDDLSDEMISAFEGLELTDEQEQGLLNLLTNAQRKSEQVFRKGSQLKEIIDEIEALIEQAF
jgi:DNA-binding response OmpR family regulator